MLLLKFSDLTLSREQMKQLKGGSYDSEDLNTCSAKCDVKDGNGGTFKSGCYSNEAGTACLCLDRSNNSQC